MSEAQISSVRGAVKSHLIAIAMTLGVLQTFNPSIVSACDTDAECGQGGTCIKREKRARGVCYGGQQRPEAERLKSVERTTEPAPISPAANPLIAGQTNGDLPIYGEEGYVEPAATPQAIDRLDIPDRTDSSCITSTDCAGGHECVYRDPMLGHGECEAPPAH